MQKKALRMNLRDVSLAEMQERKLQEKTDKCLLQLVHHAAVRLKFHSSQVRIALYIAANALQR